MSGATDRPSTVRPSRVLVGMRERLGAEVLSDWLNEQTGLESVHRAWSAETLIGSAQDHPHDVLVLDLRLAMGQVRRLTAALRQADSGIRIVGLADVTGERFAVDAAEAGWGAFAVRDRGTADLLTAVRAAAAGNFHLDAELMQRMVDWVDEHRESRIEELTARETEILTLLAQNLTSSEIADQLAVSVNTARQHVQNILTKLGVHSKVDAVDAGRRAGVLPERHR